MLLHFVVECLGLLLFERVSTEPHQKDPIRNTITTSCAHVYIAASPSLSTMLLRRVARFGHPLLASSRAGSQHVHCGAGISSSAGCEAATPPTATHVFDYVVAGGSVIGSSIAYFLKTMEPLAKIAVVCMSARTSKQVTRVPSRTTTSLTLPAPRHSTPPNFGHVSGGERQHLLHGISPVVSWWLAGPVLKQGERAH